MLCHHSNPLTVCDYCFIAPLLFDSDWTQSASTPVLLALLFETSLSCDHSARQPLSWGYYGNPASKMKLAFLALFHHVLVCVSVCVCILRKKHHGTKEERKIPVLPHCHVLLSGHMVNTQRGHPLKNARMCMDL